MGVAGCQVMARKRSTAQACDKVPAVDDGQSQQLLITCGKDDLLGHKWQFQPQGGSLVPQDPRALPPTRTSWCPHRCWAAARFLQVSQFPGEAS